ncbi:Uncharacterised protein [Mycobacterium tuberculosis]|nr:Uncharacterised protein [Mycobacterium tuberculosis]
MTSGSSAVSSCRCHAAPALTRSTPSNRSGERFSTIASSTTPAVCTTPRSGQRSGTASITDRRTSRSATSPATTRTRVPNAANSPTSACVDGLAAPDRDTSTRLRTPCVRARCRATRAPSPPVPPVIRAVPSRSHTGSAAASVAAARARRATRILPPRSSSRCSSSTRGMTRLRSAASAISASAAESSASMSRSAMRPGCSVCAERARPATAPAAGSVPVLVTTTKRAAGCRSPLPPSQSWIAARVCAARSRARSPASTIGDDGRKTTEAASASSSRAVGEPVTGSPHSTSNKDPRTSSSLPDARSASPSCEPAKGERMTRRSTSTTGSPAASTARMRRPPPPPSASSRIRVIRARSSRAPDAYRRTPLHTNGSPPSPAPASQPDAPSPWSTASSRAGCTPKPAGSSCVASGSGRATSTNSSSSPRRQTLRRPRNVGPYTYPCSAKSS